MTQRCMFYHGDVDVTVTSLQIEHQLDGCDPQACVRFSHSPSVQVYYALKTRLETCSEAWLQEFVELDGLDSFLDCLGHMTGSKFTGFSDAILQIDCLSCIRAVLNSDIGMSALVSSQDGVRKLLKGVDLVNTLPRKVVMEMLTAVCVYNKQGHTQLLQALDNYKKEKHLYHRFSFIVNELKLAETVPHKAAVMTLINAIICFTQDITERCRIRNEFIGLTLLDVLSFLRREDPDEDLYTQLQVFQTQKHEDESILDLEANLDLSSPQDLVDAIQAKVFGNPKMVSFVNILQDLLALEVTGKDKSKNLWQVLERHVHHIVHGITDIDRLAEMSSETTCQVVAAALGQNTSAEHTPTRQVNPWGKPYSATLDRDAKVMYQICPSCVRNGGVKLSADSGYVGHDDRFSPESYTCTDNQGPTNKIQQSSSVSRNQVPEKPARDPPKNKLLAARGDGVVPGRQLSMYDNMSQLKQLSHADNHRQNTDQRGHNLSDVHSSPDKTSSVVQFDNARWRVNDYRNGQWRVNDHKNGPSPQMVSSPSPSGHHSFLSFQRQKLAFPAYVMRNLKWIKLDEATVEKHPHSLWAETDTSRLKIEPDFLHLEEMFREKSVFDDTAETPLLNNKTRLDLNLFLNRLDEDPTKLVARLGCLDGPGLPLPFIRHLVEILPEHTEIQHLKFYNGNLLNLGPAEQFVLHLSDLADYQILVTGQLRRAEFAVTVPHLCSVLESMLDTSRSLLASKNLREVLMLVLRLGNFLNHGQYNGYASGFKLSSLSRLADMKSREPGHNFVHFLVDTMDAGDEKLLDFLAEIPRLEKAASYTPADVKSEFDKLNVQLNSFIRQLSAANPAVKHGFAGFLQDVKKEFRRLQSQIAELKIYSQQLAEFFCETETFDIQTCFRQLLEFFKLLRQCRQEVELMRKQKMVASRDSDQASHTRQAAWRFGHQAGASSSVREDKKQLVELILTELHRGNFHARQQPAPGTATREATSMCPPATPDRDLHLTDLSHISVLGTPMVNRPNSELFDDEDGGGDGDGDNVTITELKAGAKMMTSSVRYLADVTAPPAAGPTGQPPVFSLQQSLGGSVSHRSKTHHRSKSDLADSISATTKWIRYHQQARLEDFQAPLARPESSIMLATLNLEAGQRRLHHQVAALVPGPTVELPPSRGHPPVEPDAVFELVRGGKKGERKSGTLSHFFNRISKRVLRQRSNSDQNSDGKVINAEVSDGNSCVVRPAEMTERDGLVGKTTGVPVAGKGLKPKGSTEDKENVCDPEVNPFDRHKKNPIRLSNRFKAKSAK